MTDDILRVIDERIQHALKTINIQEAQVLNVGPRFAKIQLVGSRGIEDAYYDIAGEIDAGDYCLVTYSPVRRKFVILTAFNAPGSQTQLISRTLSSLELAPPSNVTADNFIAGTIVVQWDAPPQQAVAFEVETNTSESESGGTQQLVTRGSYAIIETTVALYARVRSIASNFEYSSWSDWVTATPTSVSGSLTVFDALTSVTGVTGIEVSGTGLSVSNPAPGRSRILFTASSVDHGSLSGLSDDDHTIYTKADGTRAFTGDQSMGNKALTNLLYLTTKQVFSASLASDAFTMTQMHHRILSETGATDDLSTITPAAASIDQLLILQAAVSHTITIKHNVGNIFLSTGADFVLGSLKTIWLYYDSASSVWRDFGLPPDTEAIQDIVGAFVTATGSGLQAVYTDGSNTFVISFSNQSANLVLSGPSSGSAAAPTFRSLVSDDIPSLAASKISDFNEAAQDMIATFLAAGNGLVSVYNDGSNTLTFSAARVVKNTSGATAVAGDVGILVYDVTNGYVYNRTTTANYPDTSAIAVVLVGGANNADIYVTNRGRVTLNYTGTAPSAGQWLTTSTSGGSAQRSTTMRPEIFAVAEANGSGGTVQVQLLTQRPFVAYQSANAIHQVANASLSDFIATINGSPSATSVVYTSPLVAGTENVINVSSASELAKLVLWNSTKSTGRLIVSVATGTNTITTVSTSDSWANGDTITIRSQTNTTTVSGASWYEIDFSQTTEIPLLATAIVLQVIFQDTGGGGESGQIHPYEANDNNKRIAATTYTTSQSRRDVPIPMINRRICVLHTASGGGTSDIILRLLGYYIAAP